ncbi:aminotransferase class I/II-fold pyridoxal phosphate-dependent enzyme [Microbacterium sp. EYE_5]|uniref:MalY/PatB family protein n=1 Tax=unclassified Microbacterium TaxID=2609290 RepID=UPI002004EF7E|nr:MULTISPECIES: aminotransferase class I/II-fold pyridoxal phosphate-dependent enzyme [unclassified Microbacterium]MCK6080511.1 aminotransferase class I/II-fold pyridoxal phosphate-dependent enzyme [Microbacterium sp. EYE_382]MCK6085782.1 aminotransferase class I/II-fold pyridoxal phosphate-dependent enzyme [Microbacterium sp. EYE_384]MCK6124720.1 aminotransferase class I/II-fold pyridoxal phosphate-dependent enzyme [Microbacterium sp. EYE_80]MCK6127629.1 aminotransferase class I/II-fold pyrid
MTVAPLDALPLHVLRRRSSTKWRSYPEDVIPMFVAETDFALAPPITDALRAAVEIGDTGYTPPRPGVADAFVGFAGRRWGWEIDPARVRWTGDVMMGVVELLRAAVAPGARVVVTPPVYPPFFDTVREAGVVVEEVPLEDTGSGWRLDLPGIDAALRSGARAVLLCNPHNPTGTAHSASDLAELARIAARHAAVVISDEIHGPLTRPDIAFTPFLTASPDAAEVGFAVTSASKTFNLAGLKCAVMVAGSDAHAEVLRGLPWEVEWRTGLFGALAHNAAFSPASDDWLDRLLARLDENRALLVDLVASHLPRARFRVPDAGFLAWLDVSAYGWGDDPAVTVRRDARVALHHGPYFGPQGVGHVRLNFGCGPDLLREAIERIGRLAAR